MSLLFSCGEIPPQEAQVSLPLDLLPKVTAMWDADGEVQVLAVLTQLPRGLAGSMACLLLQGEEDASQQIPDMATEAWPCRMHCHREKGIACMGAGAGLMLHEAKTSRGERRQKELEGSLLC